MATMTECPKCGSASGDDWSQCGDYCPMPMSPRYAFDIFTPEQKAKFRAQDALYNETMKTP